ncbi:SAP18-domain-containing protein [Gonapodya prolifera JEL478]|uniref:SAP18-domain-containing protein n=1 Tax=Gonapodya prolifera (strain JEL478) TaxID=1344416 RepID=A0A139AR21_GONPJ|nr:SAP18-domain-containing protein [Gonapodya prolifera JEL478]|eukprot:KXS19162.1 SAP18-domain-containing protein [Gonapodya prolifera JEL478]
MASISIRGAANAATNGSAETHAAENGDQHADEIMADTENPPADAPAGDAAAAAGPNQDTAKDKIYLGPQAPPVVGKSRGKPTDREKVCPHLIRVFVREGGFPSLQDLDEGKDPEKEIRLYSWPDATLREITSLLTLQHPPAAPRSTQVRYRVAYYESRDDRHAVLDAGVVANWRKGPDDDKTLDSAGWRQGDKLLVALGERHAAGTGPAQPLEREPPMGGGRGNYFGPPRGGFDGGFRGRGGGDRFHPYGRPAGPGRGGFGPGGGRGGGWGGGGGGGNRFGAGNDPSDREWPGERERRGGGGGGGGGEDTGARGRGPSGGMAMDRGRGGDGGGGRGWEGGREGGRDWGRRDERGGGAARGRDERDRRY